MSGASERPIISGQTIGQVAIVVRDYDEAIDFYVGVLGFTVIEDVAIQAQDKTLGCRGAAGLDRGAPAPCTGRGR